LTICWIPSLTHLSELSRKGGSVTAHEGEAPICGLAGVYAAARRRHSLMMLILLQRDERLSQADGRSETNRRNDYQEEVPVREEREALKASVSQTDAAKLYNRLSRVYDIWGHLTESKAGKRSLELADIKDGQHVLEIAAGTGLAFVEMVKANPAGRNIGIDISEGMLAKAEQRLRHAGCSNYELSVGSALDIFGGNGLKYEELVAWTRANE
jgi:predicted O-methyltransferase YrrM